jgi:hypothetical protein
MIEPYVDEEISWAVRTHQALRFFPDESVGYEYPEAYVRWFGPDFQPEPYVVDEYKRARSHKHYMTARFITLHDLYSFDPNAKIDLDDFTDTIGRHFKQPRRARPRQQPVSAYVAHDAVADTIPLVLKVSPNSGQDWRVQSRMTSQLRGLGRGEV